MATVVGMHPTTPAFRKELRRANRLAVGLFWLRFGRDPDGDDREELAAIVRWLVNGATLPHEQPDDARHRVHRTRAIADVIRP